MEVVDMITGLLIGLAIGAIIGGIGMVVIAQVRGNSQLSRSKREAAQTISDAERQAASIVKEGQTQVREREVELRAKMEAEGREMRKEIAAQERRIQTKEETVDKRAEQLDRSALELTAQERELLKREKQLEKEGEKLAGIILQQTQKLEDISGLTADQARRELFITLENEVKRDCALQLKRTEDELKEQAEKKARWIIGEAITRCASDHVAETTVSVVNLPNDEMKGRIIGREGRNIRALENATGINVIIDDTPEAVILSGFDPIRRQVARITLERLIQDGRIHPARIEEMVEKVNEEMATTIRERGEAACLEADVHGLHPEIVKLLGRLSFRTSYGQNVLQHSLEVCHLSGLMAAELGVNVAIAKRAGLIHDMGKALTHEVEGSHAVLGHDIAKRHGEKDIVANAVGAHHNEMPMESVEAILVQAADAMSASRPGARSESMQNYIKRLEQLEQIADQFEGVEKSYAIQAGREIRMAVNPDRISDAEAATLARDVARKVEQEMTYPGQIRVTVVRETRAVEMAK
ncbi:MAG: ribonuclease Y [Candidatus Hydrogenedentes bacterium]|nr:ribonuclease Y [Candidatus Hydrogenedentota bacterium]